MNYLAHLYLAEVTGTSWVGNFLGDFVRGRIEQTSLLKEHKAGVFLHRKIDVFTDSHPIVLQSRERISKQRRRYAGIVVDMAYDHFLASCWKQYSEQPLADFVKQFYVELEKDINLLPPDCQKIIPYLIEGNWLENYQYIEGIRFGLDGISQRMVRRFNRENSLKDSVEEIILNFEELQNDFDKFFPELIEYTKQYVDYSSLK